MSKWEKISPEMMSEEEDDDNRTFIRRRYAQRSEGFNRFIDKRIARNSKKSLAKKRTYGTRLTLPAPSHAQEWMKSGSAPEIDVSQSEEISSGDEAENQRTNQMFHTMY